MNKLIQVLLISALFALLYPLVRSLPDAECAFLHYDFVEESEEGAEYCGVDEAAVFVDLDTLRFPVVLDFFPIGRVEVGKNALFELRFSTENGRAISDEDLALVHTEKLHLFITDEKLEEYHHIHPEWIGGRFQFNLTPQRSGKFWVFTEMVLLESASPVMGKVSFTVDRGKEDSVAIPSFPSERSIEVTDLAESTRVVEAFGYRFEIRFASEPLSLNAENDLRFLIRKVADDSADPRIRFDEVMGAFVHMVAFDEEHKGFAHMHPLDGGVGLESDNPSFGFVFNSSISCKYRLWAQLSIDGQMIFVPFNVGIDP